MLKYASSGKRRLKDGHKVPLQLPLLITRVILRCTAQGRHLNCLVCTGTQCLILWRILGGTHAICKWFSAEKAPWGILGPFLVSFKSLLIFGTKSKLIFGAWVWNFNPSLVVIQCTMPHLSYEEVRKLERIQNFKYTSVLESRDIPPASEQ